MVTASGAPGNDAPVAGTGRPGMQQLLGRRQPGAMAEQVRASTAAAMSEDEQLRRAMQDSMTDYNEAVRASSGTSSNNSSAAPDSAAGVSAAQPVDEDNVATLMVSGRAACRLRVPFLIIPLVLLIDFAVSGNSRSAARGGGGRSARSGQRRRSRGRYPAVRGAIDALFDSVR